MDARTLLLLDGGTAPVPSTVSKLSTDRQVFIKDGKPWRYKGVTAFRLLDRFASGDDITPFLDAYRGYNVLRVFGYTPIEDWGVSAWNWPRIEDTMAFIEFCGAHGWYVELVLLTDDDKPRLTEAANVMQALTPKQYPNLLIEVGNEPRTHKNILTGMLEPLCVASGYNYCSGDYEDSDRWFGTRYNDHSLRSSDWTRRAKNLKEAYDGSGPDKPHRPFLVACVEDEPGKWQDVGSYLPEWRAYYGNASLMGAGATIHTETGKMAELPTEQETPLIAEALAALDTFPADAPFGAYRRIVEPGNEPGGPTEDSRTYVVGNYMVRCQQHGTDAPEPGWKPLDDWGVLWSR